VKSSQSLEIFSMRASHSRIGARNSFVAFLALLQDESGKIATGGHA